MAAAPKLRPSGRCTHDQVNTTSVLPRSTGETRGDTHQCGTCRGDEASLHACIRYARHAEWLWSVCTPVQLLFAEQVVANPLQYNSQRVAATAIGVPEGRARRPVHDIGQRFAPRVGAERVRMCCHQSRAECRVLRKFCALACQHAPFSTLMPLRYLPFRQGVVPAHQVQVTPQHWSRQTLASNVLLCPVVLWIAAPAR